MTTRRRLATMLGAGALTWLALSLPAAADARIHGGFQVHLPGVSIHVGDHHGGHYGKHRRRHHRRHYGRHHRRHHRVRHFAPHFHGPRCHEVCRTSDCGRYWTCWQECY